MEKLTLPKSETPPSGKSTPPRERQKNTCELTNAFKDDLGYWCYDRSGRIINLTEEQVANWCDFCLGRKWLTLQVDEYSWKAVPCPHCRGKSVVNDTFSFASFRPVRGAEKAYAACVAYAGGFWRTRPLFFMSGGTGCGKTHLCKAMAQKLRDDGVDVYMVTLSSFYRQLQDGIETGAGKDLYEYAKNVQVLILDDVGAQKPTDYLVQTLESLLDDRYERRRATVLTSNLEIEKLTPRLASRFSDQALAQVVVNTAGDYRKSGRRA